MTDTRDEGRTHLWRARLTPSEGRSTGWLYYDYKPALPGDEDEWEVEEYVRAPTSDTEDDWRKGVELIASALGMDTLSCVHLAERALELRAEVDGSDTEDVGEEELMECANCGQVFDWTDDIQSTFHERACGEIGSLYPHLLPAMSARLRRTPETEALVKRFRRPAEIPHYGPDADGFWLLRRTDVIALLEGREPLATQDPNAGGEDD